MNYSEIYFAVTSVSTIALAGLLVLCLMYVLSILHDIKRLSKIAKKEAEIIAKGFEEGVSVFGSELSNEAAGFLRTVFTLLLSQFSGKGNRKIKKTRVKSI